MKIPLVLTPLASTSLSNRSQSKVKRSLSEVEMTEGEVKFRLTNEILHHSGRSIG